MPVIILRVAAAAICMRTEDFAAAVPRKSVMRPFCTTDFPILRSGVASSFPEGLSVACCVRHLDKADSASGKSKFFNFWTKAVSCSFSALLSWWGKLQALDGRQNKKQEISRSA
jgi:hypothetical protein